jgi:seryl-tRNA synthetase
MNKFNIGVIFAIAIQFGTFVWFLSSQNSKIETLYKFYEAESAKEVITNQVKMKLDLENMVISVNEVTKELTKIKKQMERFAKKTNQISNQIEKFHKKERKGTIIQQSN